MNEAKHRSLEQNRKMWAMLADISSQVMWLTAQGEECKPIRKDWKDILTALIKKQRMYVGVEGGIVMCGESTSEMTSSEMNELIELIYWFGSEHSVVWSDPQMIGLMETMR